jgi:hypothetical protein
MVTTCQRNTAETSWLKVGMVRKMLVSYNGNTCDVVNEKVPVMVEGPEVEVIVLPAGCSFPH